MTAVEWLIKRYQDYGTLYYEDMTQAKAMGKEQIMNAFFKGKINHNKDLAIEYYNESYPKKSTWTTSKKDKSFMQS